MTTTAAHNSHDLWFYDRFCMSYRDVQALLVERGIDVTYEAIRRL